MLRSSLLVAVPVLLAASAASATITITRGDSAPTYATTLNFDEPAGPTGSVPSGSWSALGMSSIVSGTGNAFVGNLSSIYGVPGLGTGNAATGAFGLYMNFSQDLTEMSFQYWDSATASGPFGGGAAVIVLNDGVEINRYFISNPNVGGNTNSWFNVVATGGSTFDDVRLVGFGGAFPEAFTDNVSWNAVPAPGSLALLGLGGLAAIRRRR